MIDDPEAQGLCKAISAGILATVADFIQKKIDLPRLEQTFQGNGVFLPNETMYQGRSIRAIDAPDENAKQKATQKLRKFISVWYKLERLGLVRSMPFDKGHNTILLFWANKSGPGPSQGAYELFCEAEGFLDKKIVPLSDLADFMTRNNGRKVWLTQEEEHDREVLEAAKRSNCIALAVGSFSVLVGAISILSNFIHRL